MEALHVLKGQSRANVEDMLNGFVECLLDSTTEVEKLEHDMVMWWYACACITMGWCMSMAFAVWL